MVYNKIGSLIAIAFLLASCDSFLDRSPNSQANTKDFYSDADDIGRAVNSIYGTIRDVYQEFWLFGDLRSDISELENPGPYDPRTFIDNFSLASVNVDLNNMWIDHYRVIARSNVVLNRMEGLEIEQPIADQYRGEALFLRSLMYFNLVRVFGGVPLILEEISSVEGAFQAKDRTRDPALAIYDQIISDLERAAQLLPQSYVGEDRGRATWGAANAVLGKVYLTRHEFSAAAGVLEKVITSGQYRLLDDYADIYDNDNPLNDEIIFTVLYNADGLGHGSPYTAWFTSPQYNTEVATTDNTLNIPTTSLLEAYEPNDVERSSATVVTQFVNATGDTISRRFNKKYFSLTPFPGQGHDDWPVLRYADVLLMYAEALNELGRTTEAYEPLNRVRERAGLEPLSGLSQAEFQEAVSHERMIELAFEGHRWFALVRTGRAIEVMANAEPSYNIEEHQLLFPVPQAQIDVSAGALEQNPGY